MIATFEGLRDWAADRASDWFRGTDGEDRLAEDRDLTVGEALRVEAFNLLLPLAVEAGELSTDLGRGGLIERLKGAGVDRAVRVAALRATGFGRSEAVEPVPIAFVAEFVTPSGLEPMRLVAAALPGGRWRTLAGDPRVVRRWRLPGKRHLALTVPWRDERQILRRATREAADRWAEIRRSPPAFALNGRDLTKPALDRLEPLVLRSSPWLRVEREAIRRRVEALRPDWVVVASDQHRLGRLAVDVARGAGARSLVLQHGWPQYRLGYLPVVADRVATWSAASDEWFVEGGTAPNRLDRLGNPRLDPMLAGDRETTRAGESRRLSLDGRPAILVALSPSDAGRNLALVDLALSAAERDSSAAVVIKLHPGDGRWQDVRRRVDEAPSESRSRIRVQRSEPIGPLLRWADLTLLHRSTVAVEALALGTPVAVGAVGAPSPDDALPDDLELPEVSTADDLLATARSVVEPAGRDAFIARRRAAVERVAGPIDGRSAQRIAEYLLGGGR